MVDQKLHRQMRLTQLSTVRYLLRQGMAARDSNKEEGNLAHLLLNDIPQLKVWLKEKR
jgi:hypothetical protein